jgi:Icc-related predicted phosphoesterase
MELKRQLMIFVETEVLPAIVNLGSSEHRHFIVEVFEYLCNNGHLHTMDLLAKTMVNPGDEYPLDLKPVLKIDEFKSIYNAVALKCA